MDNQIKDLKFFLLYHYENGLTKKELLTFLMELEEEKKIIISTHFKRNIKDMKPILIKQCIGKYLQEITKYLDKTRKSQKRRVNVKNE